MAIRCTIDGRMTAEALQRYVTTKDRQLKAELRRLIIDMKQEVSNKTQSRSGKLKRSYATVSENSGYTQILGSKSFYLHLVSDDTAEHDVKPVKKKILAWGGYVGKGELTSKKGNIIRKKIYMNSHGQLSLNKADAAHQNFAKEVHTPAHTGTKFFEETLTEDRQKIVQALFQVLKRRS